MNSGPPSGILYFIAKSISMLARSATLVYLEYVLPKVPHYINHLRDSGCFQSTN